MKGISKEQIRRIYGMGSKLDIVGSSGRDDGLHALVYALCGKASVSSLLDAEARLVMRELSRQLSSVPADPGKLSKRHPVTPGGLTEGQQRKIWKLMYRLQAVSPSGTPVGKRLCGVIHKEFGIDAAPRRPFQWLDFAQGDRLIECLKGYVRSAEALMGKAGERDVGDAGTDGAAPTG